MDRMARGSARAVVLTAALASVAYAGPDPDGARLFEQGRTLAKQGKYDEACKTFEKSLAIDPAMGTKLNYADCHEHLAQLAEAWRLFDEVAEAEKITNPSRAKYARERADALLPKVGVLVLKVASPSTHGLTIKVGDHAITPAATVHEVVDPGTVEISATAGSAAPFEHSETVEAGETITVEVPAFPEDKARPTEAKTVRRRSRVYLAYGLGAGGVLAFASGVLVGVTAKGDYQAQLDNNECMLVDGSPVCSKMGYDEQQRALRLASVGTWLGVGGIALLAAGAAVFLTAPRDLVVMPTADSQSAGVAVVGNF
jgi:tetratricopeptide (TPR) repeat protein